MRWLAMLLGLFGTYRTHETVDVEYRLGGQVKLASDVEIFRIDTARQRVSRDRRSLDTHRRVV